MNTISLQAYGKINIGLDVTGRRFDGYHYVRMIMQTVGICDTVSVTADGMSGMSKGVSRQKARIFLTCDEPKVPRNEHNLAWKAAERIAGAYGLRGDIHIHLEKKIPMAAGMAGGSTDAAAVIKAMNILFGLRLSQEEMDMIALKLGADVPFCLRQGTWLSEGIGEKLTRITDAPKAHVLIVNPQFAVSTGDIYRALDDLEHPEHPDIDAMIGCIDAQDLFGLSQCMGNILASVTEKMHPRISEIRQKMLENGALGSLMTGSGPTVFGLYDDRDRAEGALRFFEDSSCYGKCFLTEFIR